MDSRTQRPTPVNEPPTSSASALRSETAARLASSGAAQRRGKPQSPEHLKGRERLRNSKVMRTQEWRFVGLEGKSRFNPVSGRATANNGDALRVPIGTPTTRTPNAGGVGPPP